MTSKPTEKKPTAPTVSIKTSDVQADIDAIRAHMISVLPGIEPSNPEVVRWSVKTAASTLAETTANEEELLP